ncbi:hypothetical protein [Streptomyces sp. NPDC051546]|uniref:hypothetical protein n=1 Tax=Streptomyces sp. NPDC051546 TaxID=3365655 RepID=UPI0037BDE38A
MVVDMTDSCLFEYEILVPDIDGWGTPAQRGAVADWTGTAYDLGRDILKRWQEAPSDERYAGAKATVEVTSDHGAYAAVDDPTPVGPVEQALEEAIEAKLIADFAHDRTAQALAEAMCDAHRWGGMSKNKIADRVGRIMSRPTAMKQLKGVWPAEETYDITVTGTITYGAEGGPLGTITCSECGATENHTVFGSPAGEVRLFCENRHSVDLPAEVDGRRLLEQSIENPDAGLSPRPAPE